MTRDEIVTAYTKRLSAVLTTVEPKEYWAVQSVLTAAILDADLEARQELNPIIRKQETSLKAYEEEVIELVRRMNHEKDRRSAVLKEMIGLNQVISNLQVQAGKMADEKEEMRRSLELRALAIREARADAAAAGERMAQALDEADDAKHQAERLAAEVQGLNRIIAAQRVELKHRRDLAQEAHDERNMLIFRLNAMGARNQELMLRVTEANAGVANSESTPSPLADRGTEWVIGNLRFQNDALRAEMRGAKLAAAFDEATIEDARLAAVATVKNQAAAIANLSANLANRTDEVANLRGAKAQDEQAIASLRCTVAALRESLDRTAKDLEFANACLQESDGRVSAVAGELALCREEADQLASELIEAHKRHEQDLIHLRAGLESQEAELNQAKVANQALADQAEYAKGWRHKLQEEHDHELARAVVTFEGQIHGLVKERDAREAQFLKASNALVDSERAAISLSRQLVDMTLERDEVRAEIKRLYGAYQGVAELQSERDSLRAELTRVTDGLTERITELRKERDAFRKQMDANDGLVRELAVERDSLKRKVARLEEGKA